MIPLYKITYIKSDGHYLEYYLTDGKIKRSRGSLSKKEKLLIHYDFIRVHKRYIVNMKHISRVDRYNDIVYIMDNEEVNLGKAYKEHDTIY